MAERWHMVRLSDDTYNLLLNLRDRMNDAYSSGQASYSLSRDGDVSLNTVVWLLLRRDARHRERKDVSKRSRRKAKQLARRVYTLASPGNVSQAIPDQTTDGTHDLL